MKDSNFIFDYISEMSSTCNRKSLNHIVLKMAESKKWNNFYVKSLIEVITVNYIESQGSLLMYELPLSVQKRKQA